MLWFYNKVLRDRWGERGGGGGGMSGVAVDFMHSEIQNYHANVKEDLLKS